MISKKSILLGITVILFGVWVSAVYGNLSSNTTVAPVASIEPVEPHITNDTTSGDGLIPPKTDNRTDNSTLSKPSYIPTLRPYEIDKSHDIWMAQNPSSYITPENEWVRYYASQLYVDVDGHIKYKNTPVPWVVDKNGNVIRWTDKPFLNNYTYDWEQFGTGVKGSLANDDYWVNADYYLTHGMKGDCGDWSIAVTSMMLSGEMSVKESDGTFKKQFIPAKSIIGTVNHKTNDMWTEYTVYNKTFITSTARITTPDNAKISSTTFYEKRITSGQYEPEYEFTYGYSRRV